MAIYGSNYDYGASPRYKDDVIGASTCLAFDMRFLSKAVTPSSGTAAGDDLGAINYYFRDMDENEGLVVLPYG